jgi:hypothetical protein
MGACPLGHDTVCSLLSGEDESSMFLGKFHIRRQDFSVTTQDAIIVYLFIYFVGVGIVTRLRGGRWGFVQTGCGANTASYTMGAGFLVQAAGV